MSNSDVKSLPGLLIVEDDVAVRDMICDIFDSSEYKKYVAGDGIEALHLLATGIVIDTILCDINMPNMDGIELLQKIRFKGIDAPIIFLTGEDNPSFLIKALQGGAFDFLYKTGDLNKLYKTVMNGLEIGLKIRALKGKDHLSFKNFRLSENEMEIKRKILLMKSYLDRRKNVS